MNCRLQTGLFNLTTRILGLAIAGLLPWAGNPLANGTLHGLQTDQVQQETGQNEQEVLRWKKLKPEDAGFEVQFPGEPQHVPRTVQPRADLKVSVDMYALSLYDGRVAMMVGYHQVQELPKNDAQRKETLDGGIKGTMVNVAGRLTSHEEVTVQGHPARVFTYRGLRGGRQVIGKSQLVLVGQRVYQLTLLGLPKGALTEIKTDGTAEEEAETVRKELAQLDIDSFAIDAFFSSFVLIGDDGKPLPDPESETEDK